MGEILQLSIPGFLSNLSFQELQREQNAAAILRHELFLPEGARLILNSQLIDGAVSELGVFYTWQMTA